MKYIVSYSGGLGSFAATVKLLDSGVAKDDIELVFCDTLIEDEDLYRFLDETSSALGLPVTRLQDGRTPWGVYVAAKRQGNSKIAPCSEYLKRAPFKKHLKKYKGQDVTVVLGIGPEEVERIERARLKYDVPVIAPLCQKPMVFHHEYDAMLKRFGIKKPRLYEMGFQHNNCGGFCCRAGLAHFKLLYEQMPERYKWHEQQQEAAVAMCPEIDRPFLRKTLGGNLGYKTLKKYRVEIEAGKHREPMFDFMGCGCFVDD